MNKALLNNTYIMGGSFGKTISLNELNVFFPELFEKMEAKTTQHLYGAVTWIYRATQIRANALQGLKYKVFKGETEVFDSRVEGAMQPWFPETDLVQLLWRSQADRMLWGASYWEKVGNWMMPTNLRRLNPLTMEVVGDPKIGIKRFEQRIEGIVRATWLPREIVYQPLWRPDNDIQPGVAPAAVATMAAGLNENALRYAANFFEHGAIPPLLLTTDQNLPDIEIQRVKTVWQRMHGSVRNAWRTAVLRRGLKPVTIGQRTKDLAIPDLHAVVIAEIAAAYGMSVTFLEGKTANRATDEQETLKFVTGALVPDAELFESGMNTQLWDGMGLRWEYLVGEIEAIQKNEAVKAEGVSEMIGKAIEAFEAKLISHEQGAWVVAEYYSQMGTPFPKELPGPEKPEPIVMLPQPAPQEEIEGFARAVTPPLMLPAPPTKALQPSIEAMWEDVHKWRRVVKRLGPEKALARGFESDVLTEDTQQYVRMHLELADTTEEALEIFEHPFAKAVRETAEGDQDPNAAAKDRDEARIGLDMRRFFKVQLARIIKKLGKKPDINRLDFEFWRKEKEALGAVLQPHIDRMVEAGALTAYDTNPVTGGSGSKQSEMMLAFDWTLIAEEAAAWAERYGGELITGIEDTTQRIVTKKVAAFVRTPGMTIGDLRNSLLPWFNQIRAQMIAVTETTAAYSEGQRVLIDRATQAGLRVEPVWQTTNDEIVRECPICWPNHRKTKKQGWTVDWPPGHPRCRCFITQKWEVPRVERAPVELAPAFAPSVGLRERTRIRALEVAENTIVGHDIETAVIIDERGEVLLSKTGTHNSVTFTDDEVKLMRGATLTHNHPGGTSFSPGDVAMLRRNNLVEIRAVGTAPDGVTRLYRLHPDAKFYTLAARPQDVDEDIREQDRKVKDDWGPRIVQGSLTMEDANRDHWHEVMTRFAKDYIETWGIDVGYSREAM